MTETQEKIVAAVDAAGGNATWQQVIESLDYRERQRALTEIRPLEKEGILKRIVSFSPENGTTFTVSKVGG